MISFSQDEWACSQIYSLKGLDRLIELLKSLNFDKNNTESYPLIIELSLLLMSNLTQNKEGVIQLLHLGEKNHEGVHFIYLFEKWINPKTSILFKFAGNVFSNVTAIKEGRESLISPEYQLISNLIGVVNSPIREIRIGALHTLRNLTFEFESECFQNQVINEKSEFIDPLMNLIARMMVFGTVDEKVKSEIKSLQLNINHMEALKDVKFDEEIIMPLELILVLTNLPEIEKRAKFQKEKLSQLLLIMKPLVKSEIKDKIDVVLCIFCQIAPDL